MDSPHFQVQQTSQGETVYSFSRPLDFHHAQDVWESILKSLRSTPPRKLILDFQHISTIDSSGFALIRILKRYCEGRGIPLEHRAIPAGSEYFVQFLESPSTAPS